MPTFLGLDSSTQSLSAVIINSESGSLKEASVNFGNDLPEYGLPSGYDSSVERGEVHSNPLMWLDALDLLLGKMKADGVDFSSVTAVSGSGQQHGSVYLKGCFGEKLASLDASQNLKDQLAGCLSRKSSPIWMDSSTSAECEEIADQVGGNGVVCEK